MGTIFEAGNALLWWVVPLGIFLIFVGLAFVSRLILGGLARLFAHRTKTILDDLIIRALTGPVFVALIVLGLWLAITRITVLSDYLPFIGKLVGVVYVGIAAVAVVRVFDALLRWYGSEIASRTETDLDDKLVPILRRVGSAVIYVVALIVVLDLFDIEISPLIAGLGIGGLAVALALQSTMSNFLAGTYVISDAVIKEGHYIMLKEGPEGFVEDIGWRITRIRDWQGNLVIMPNSKLAEAVVTDYEKPDRSMLFTVDCGVSYDSDLAKVERVTIETAAEVLQRLPEGDKDFQPVVRFKEFGDSNINFAIVLKAVDRRGHFMVKHELIKALHKRFQEEGIDIQYPARKIYFADGRPASFINPVAPNKPGT